VGLIGLRSEREKAGRPGGHGLQQGLPGHAVERALEVQLQGDVPREAPQARPQDVADALATLKNADRELLVGEGRTNILAGGRRAKAREQGGQRRTATGCQEGSH
jgi:hypothetical protein